ncbi:MAG: hypothetical protein KDD19_25650, partial [Phaeodactylibacter sp.]|nr:hypothetical protein [Phaeodactylibacter sp.]
MLPVNVSYPFFQPNQVLSNEHLNQLFNYLDEQERLTRTNLIGIGIVCGLNPKVATDGTSIRISQGCGVTSKGFLIVWKDPGPLEFFRPYVAPEDVRYDTFIDDSMNPEEPFPLWELMPDRNDDPDARA